MLFSLILRESWDGFGLRAFVVLLGFSATCLSALSCAG